MHNITCEIFLKDLKYLISTDNYSCPLIPAIPVLEINTSMQRGFLCKTTIQNSKSWKHIRPSFGCWLNKLQYSNTEKHSAAIKESKAVPTSKD